MIDELRELIVSAAPDPALVQPVRTCRPDDVLDELMPFSSVVVLGVVVALEHRWGIRVHRRDVERACEGGATLTKLAVMVSELRQGTDA